MFTVVNLYTVEEILLYYCCSITVIVVYSRITTVILLLKLILQFVILDFFDDFRSLFITVIYYCVSIGQGYNCCRSRRDKRCKVLPDPRSRRSLFSPSPSVSGVPKKALRNSEPSGPTPPGGSFRPKKGLSANACRRFQKGWSPFLMA